MEDIGKELPTVASIVNTAAAARGQLVAGDYYKQAGIAARAAADYRADALESGASDVRGAAQQRAHFTRREGRFAKSRALAAAAASGGGATDPTVVKILSEIEGQSEYEALSDLYSGESQAYALEQEAEATRYGGRLSEYTGRLRRSLLRQQALNTIASGAMTLASRYGQGGPPALPPVTISKVPLPSAPAYTVADAYAAGYGSGI